ncbi:hypothetical protein [Spirosoma aerolatum]|uniref:hypothetical protein n=1 Tax=Spirosoma aerolatum TaxID=1211326 RepID=UPI0015D0B9B1|nr:hypothetical protein [Spirosoma aerolatum]
MNYSVRLIVSFALLLSLSQCKEPSETTPSDSTPTRDDNMALGNPDGAKSSGSSPNAYLITRSTYSLSYNDSTGIAIPVELASVSDLERIGFTLRR